jgi:hypothetical protein
MAITLVEPRPDSSGLGYWLRLNTLAGMTTAAVEEITIVPFSIISQIVRAPLAERS